MRRLIEKGKVEVREVDEFHRELAVLSRGLLQPLRDGGADTAGTGGADDDVEFECQGVSSMKRPLGLYGAEAI
jgi:hypothetical protein